MMTYEEFSARVQEYDRQIRDLKNEQGTLCQERENRKATEMLKLKAQHLEACDRSRLTCRDDIYAIKTKYTAMRQRLITERDKFIFEYKQAQAEQEGGAK